MGDRKQFLSYWHNTKPFLRSYITIDEAWDIWQAARRWIPVTERLPEKSGGCLIFNCGCESAFYDATNKQFETDDEVSAEPTHWQPLPPPPEE